MARKPQSRPGRRLAATLLALAALYTTMVATGHTSPRLGLDLEGGTTLTLRPVTDKGAKPSAGSLAKAVDIIRQRVNGEGVSEAEVVRQGSFIIISVPGRSARDLAKLGDTAELDFREVYTATSVAPAPVPSSSPGASATPGAKKSPTAAPVVKSSPTAATTSKRALSAALLSGAPQTAPSPTSPASPTAPASAHPTPVPTATTGTSGRTLAVDIPPQTPNSPTPPVPVLQFFSTTHSCDVVKATFGIPSQNKPQNWIVACDRAGVVKYLLKPAKVIGTDVKGATATIQTGPNGTTTGDVVVDIQFTGKGQDKFTKLTEATVNKQVAIVLDNVVQSSPRINERIPGDAQISGNFTQTEAEDLANILKYGALPLTFEKSQQQSVSATVGHDSLRAGLLAGGLGLGLVLLYCFVYYRALGIVTIVSLSVSALFVYACVVLLGASGLRFTLSLAGIAGLIVSIGITADSFVVFYERLKDEVREGRTPRSSVERGWVRARRTIVSADVVSLLASVVLYLLSVGSVRGFAFTLGLSTLLDLVVVFFFTRPLVELLVRRRFFSSGRFSGLSVVAASGRSERGRAGQPATPKEA